MFKKILKIEVRELSFLKHYMDYEIEFRPKGSEGNNNIKCYQHYYTIYLEEKFLHFNLQIVQGHYNNFPTGKLSENELKGLNGFLGNGLNGFLDKK